MRLVANPPLTMVVFSRGFCVAEGSGPQGLEKSARWWTICAG